MALVQALDHFNISTDRLAETVAFFEEVLELENRPEDRPNFGFGGAWLFTGDRALVHLVEVESSKGQAAGALDHVAFATDDLDALVARLERLGIDHRIPDNSRTGLRQVFFREPNGVQIEVTCPA